MFLAQYWGLETSSRPFCDFIKMTIQQHLAIFNSLHLSFLVVPSLVQPLKKVEHWNIDVIDY